MGPTVPSVHLLLLLAHFSHSQRNVTVVTSKGEVVGLRVDPNPVTNVSYDAFLGVPYGQIPARFQPPVPCRNWSSPLVAQRDGPACPQPNVLFSEDCLYLNIFTPINASLTPGKIPVMVFIHGSAFTTGFGSSRNYGPDFLVPHGVVLVVPNYRLGAAGFLTLGSPIAPGNLGIYDSCLALNWVQEEISLFGGDPEQVTLFGQSAGSAVTQFLYLSPVCSGLFKQAIAQSGSALSDRFILPVAEAVRRTKLLAEAVGCDPSLDSALLLMCLQQTDISIIVNKQNISLPIEDMVSGKTIQFLPVLDSSFAKPPFFSDTLENLMKEALIRAKPLLTGFVTEEGITMFKHKEWKLAEANLAGFIPNRIRESLNENQKITIVSKIRDRYFPITEDENKILDLVKIYTDAIYVYPTIEFARYFANFTYGYIFSYDSPWVPTPSYFSQFHVSGVTHAADVSYLFYSTNSSQDLAPCTSNTRSLGVRDNMVKWWTSFAKLGMPDPLQVWRPLSKGEYLVIGSASSFVNCSEVEESHFIFWETLNTDNNPASVVKANLLSFIVFQAIIIVCFK